MGLGACKPCLCFSTCSLIKSSKRRHHRKPEQLKEGERACSFLFCLLFFTTGVAFGSSFQVLPAIPELASSKQLLLLRTLDDWCLRPFLQLLGFNKLYSWLPKDNSCFLRFLLLGYILILFFFKCFHICWIWKFHTRNMYVSYMKYSVFK